MLFLARAEQALTRAGRILHRVRRIDVLTLIAIAAFVNVTATIIHEAFGHGLAAAIFGAHIIHVTSVDLSYDEHALNAVQNRIVAAAGPLANVVAGLLVLVFAGRVSARAPVLRYLLWLFGHANLFVAGGYAMALSFASFGDMNAIVSGLPASLAWRIALTILGVAISASTLLHAARTLVPFAGEETDRQRRAVILTAVPYLTMGVIAVSAGSFNPDSPLLIVISAAASSFGGNAWIAWIPAWMRRFHGTEAQPLGLPRSFAAIALGFVALLVDFIALAPGLPR